MKQDIQPLADGRIDPGYYMEGEETYIGRIDGATRPPDVEQLRPVPAPNARRSWQYLYLWIRDTWPFQKYPTNQGEKVVLEPLAQYSTFQGQNPPDIFRKDSIRMVPEPWSVNLPQGGDR